MDSKKRLKTLKDIKLSFVEEIVVRDTIKAEAIKWVKEDREAYCRLHEDDMNTWMILLNRWMKRLNITEEDLK